MVLAHVIVLARVMVLAIVMVLACVLVLVCVMVRELLVICIKITRPERSKGAKDEVKRPKVEIP